MSSQCKKTKPIAVALGAGLAMSVASVSLANAQSNPFEAKQLQSGYMLAGHGDKAGEGKCGAGKCGAGKCGGEDKSADKSADGKCGAGKCGGEDKAADKGADGKCGAGKCGGEDKGDRKAMPDEPHSDNMES